MIRPAIAALVFAAGAVPAAASAPAVSLQMKTQVLNGATTIRAGTVLRYTIVATNRGDGGAYALTPAAHVPAHTVFLNSPPAARASVEYSVDGRTWSPHPTVVQKVNGLARVVAAAPSSYVGIRWHVQGALPAHESESFSYDVRVK